MFLLHWLDIAAQFAAIGNDYATVPSTTGNAGPTVNAFAGLGWAERERKGANDALCSTGLGTGSLTLPLRNVFHGEQLS